MPRRSSQATRAALREAALDLFQRQGFDGTTVAQVAAAAGVSHMTFFRHFPTKESVVIDDPYDPLMSEAVAAQPPGWSGLDRARRGLLAAWRQLGEPGGEQTRARARLVAGHAGLRAAMVVSNRRTEVAIIEALTRTGTPRTEAVAATGACLGALSAVILDWASGEDDTPLGERIAAALAQLGGERP